MTQFVSLSSNVQALVNRYANRSRAKSPFDSNIFKKLLISVYAHTENADVSLLAILEKYMIDLADYYTSQEIDILVAEFSSLAIYCHQYDEIFYTQSDYLKKLEGVRSEKLSYNFKTPKSLVELCLKMSDCKANSHIYLPFAGTCPFALYQKNPCVYDTAEIDLEIWAYSKILLLSQDVKANMECWNCMVLNGDDDTYFFIKNKYDYIFSFPPILGGRDEKYIADTFLYYVKNALKDNGEMYCILPMSFCYDHVWFEFREFLLKKSGNMYSAIVISLPSLFKPYTAISMCLLCIKKDGKGTICLVDATDESFSALKDLDGWKQNILKTDSIIETISKQDEKYVWVGKSENLSGEMNIQPSRYLISYILHKVNDGEKLFKLSDLVDVVPFTGFVINKKTEEIDIPVIGMKELSSSYLNCDIYRKDMPSSKKIGYRILTSDCLLIGFIGGKLKVGRTHGISKTSPVALRPDIITVNLKSDAITEDFLLRCIMDKETELQANRLSSGTIISRLRPQDFLSILVIVPTLISQQESLCKEDTRSSLTESDRKLLESAESFRRDIHMKKHAIGQTIFNLNNWMKVLQRARRDGNGIVDDKAVVGTVHKINVADIYSNLQAIMQELQIKISKLDSGYGMQCSEIQLVEFVEDYIQKNQSPVFQYVFDAMSYRVYQKLTDESVDIIIEQEDPMYYVTFPIEALTIIFDNIISNACCHGFENAVSSKNLVKIEITSEGEDIILNISNNGKPLVNGYDSESVLTYGVSSKEGNGHYGIGGYEVRKLMQEFDGDAKFISNPDDEFSVTYKLIFHKK